MAELAAGIMGIVSFGVQLVDTANKARSFCEAIRDAPSDLKENIEEIGLVASAMANMTPSIEDDMPEATSLTASVLLCRTALGRLTTLTNDMKCLLGKKHTGSFRLAIRKKDLDLVSKRLERCKTLLVLAQQAYTTARYERQLDRMECRIREPSSSHIATKLARRCPAADVNVVHPHSADRWMNKAQSGRRHASSSAALTLRLMTPALSS